MDCYNTTVIYLARENRVKEVFIEYRSYNRKIIKYAANVTVCTGNIPYYCEADDRADLSI